MPYLRVVSLSPDLRVFGFVFLMGLVSAWAPSRRAARVNPLEALRQE